MRDTNCPQLKQYEAPKLIDHGDVRTLTQANLNKFNKDNANGHADHRS